MSEVLTLGSLIENNKIEFSPRIVFKIRGISNRKQTKRNKRKVQVNCTKQGLSKMAKVKDDGTRYTWQEIADRFGVEHSTVSRIWSGKGLDITWPKKLVDDWLLANIIEPLRSGDTKGQIQKATLRKLEAEADIKEMELRQQSGELIPVAVVQQTLSQYFYQLRLVLRSIPASSYVELFESADALELKIKLQEKIDDQLNEIGSYEYEGTYTDEQLPEDDEGTNEGGEVDPTSEATTTSGMGRE